ncbi:hypothetical protein F3J14_14180 [Burkholderia sp. Tr-862]|uniref:hypothetical protein n=1 Tax=Burkholderia sp. Tr-862 TaxID=2608331 RepID=UPI00141A46F3|nr:hypothetical protein [Burkholderia sp. Tr-862]NIF42012.1 hypothetical protein [Burkholderia sp. Tr-862]
MKLPIKRLIFTAALGVATAAHATGLPVVDDGGRAQVAAAIEQVRALQAQLPANLGAQPSTYAEVGKAASAPDQLAVNQQILATLIRIDTTLQQTLEFDRARGVGLLPAIGTAAH